MRKKLCIYSIYTIISATIAYYLIVQYGHNTQDIIQRIYDYNRYIIYTGASIIIGATIWQEKTIRSKVIIGILSTVHIISLSKIILHDQYGAQLHMFLISTLSIAVVYGILRIPKALLRSILLVPSLAIMLISVMLATSNFDKAIDGRDSFYNTQKTRLHIYINEPMLVIQEAQANINIKKTNIENQVWQSISITQPIRSNIEIPLYSQIEFISSIPLGNSALFVQSPNGSIYNIYSQSLTTISLGTGGLIVQTTGIVYTWTISELIQEHRNKIITNYNKQKASYLQNMLTNQLRNNKYIQYVWWQIISYLAQRFAYMKPYEENFQKRQNMREEVNLPTSKDVSWIITIPNMPLIRSRREKFTNPQ